MMGILSFLTGNSSAIRNIDSHDPGFASVLFDDEELEVAFRMARDYVAFTSHRIIIVDKQGLTGRKRSYFSIPYGRVVAFSSETRGSMDNDSELTIHVQGLADPVSLQFSDGEAAQLVQRGIAAKACA
jgi:hypothetical protein